MNTLKPNSEHKLLEKLIILILGKEQDFADPCVVFGSYIEF